MKTIIVLILSSGNYHDKLQIPSCIMLILTIPKMF